MYGFSLTPETGLDEAIGRVTEAVPQEKLCVLSDIHTPAIMVRELLERVCAHRT